jgi:UDP-4-amino-4,6-dideoxy-N-acetyl-beta-L-altrosamine transaminase
VIPYSTQTINADDIKAVVKVLKSNYLTNGPTVQKFEKLISNNTKSKYALTFNSATSALHLSCLALGLKKNDYFWTVPNTFVSSATCGLLCGAKVDLVDIDLSSNNISIQSLKDKLYWAKKNKKLPKIIIPVHLAGFPYKQDEIWELSKEFNFKIIEDASHAFSAKYKKNIVGNCKWSDITVFSFHPVKILTTAEGGAITTNNEDLFKKLSILRDNGLVRNKKDFKLKNTKKWYYEHQLLGYNYRMNEMQAALGISQLRKIKNFQIKRKKIAKIYSEELSQSSKIQIPIFKEEFEPSLHLYVIKVKKNKRDNLLIKLKKRGIYTNVHYLPIHLQPYFKKLGFKKGQYPNSEKYGSEALSIPIYPNLKNKEQKKVIKEILRLL